jgi:hypothetical protein
MTPKGTKKEVWAQRELEEKQAGQQAKFNAAFDAAEKEIAGLKEKCQTSIKQVILNLAEQLKKLGFHVDKIANEIVHQSNGRWGSRAWILRVLPDEFKDKVHQESAKAKNKQVPIECKPQTERSSSDNSTTNGYTPIMQELVSPYDRHDF